MNPKFLLTACIVMFSCAGTGGYNSIRLTVPASDSSFLVCGSVIVENNIHVESGSSGDPNMESRERKSLSQVEESYRKGITIILLGRHRAEDGDFRYETYSATTDENGYFYIENVPRGDYALKGFQLYMMSGADLNVSSSLYGADAPYLKVFDAFATSNASNVQRAAYFPFPAIDGIVNLRHNVFFSSNTAIVGHQALDLVQNQSFNFRSQKYTMRPAEEYLMQRFPDNGWTEMLRVSARKTLAR